MHRSALAAAEAVTLAVDFLHHPRHVAPLGDAMTMAAVRRSDHVAGAELRADADGGGFFACVEVDEAWNFTGGEFVVDAILEAPDRRHVAIAFKEKLSAVLHVSSLKRAPASRDDLADAATGDGRAYTGTAPTPTV